MAPRREGWNVHGAGFLMCEFYPTGEKMTHPRLRDLGLTYEQAAHGVQSAINHDMVKIGGGRSSEPKHMRVGIDMTKADMIGLAMLLIDKGVFTEAEHIEYMRLAANEELAMREAEYNGKVTFR
jgi:hypothetical protein